MSIASVPIGGSPDITTLAFSVKYDISGATPAITLTNASTVVHPTALKWWYVITSPSGTPIHTGSLASPDKNLVAWTTLSIAPGTWPTPFGVPPCSQVEFSNNAPYVCTLCVNDSNNNTFCLPINQTITRPNGNSLNSCGNFGVSAVAVEVRCNDRVVFCGDDTNFAYQSILAPTTPQSNTWTLVYPADPNGNQPANAVFNNTPYVNFPIEYSGDGYVLNLRNYATYDMGNGASIAVQYKAINPDTGAPGIPFAVLCNIDLCKLQCQISTFEKLARQKCGNVVYPELNNQIIRMNLLLSQAIIGVFQPTCGINVPKIIAQIQAIGDLDENCDCGCKDTGINFSYPASSGNSSGTCCPVSVSVVNITSSPPTSCEATVYPVQVYDPTNSTVIGIANSMTEVLYLINSNSAWMIYGVAFSEGSCKIGFFPATPGNTIPNVYIASSSNSTACVGNTQNYTVRMQDVCLSGTSVSPSDFPLNAYVNFGAGEVSLGSVSSVAALITALNATPTKPSAVTFSDSGATTAVSVNIFNSSCTSFSTPITVSTDAGSSSFLFNGASHLNYSSTPSTINGAVDAYGLKGNVIIGKISGVSTSNIQWHVSRKDNMLAVTETNTGKIYFWDVSIPLQPMFVRTIQLSTLVSGNFSGLPQSRGLNGTTVNSFYSLYFPTDTGIFDIGSVFVFETLTGSAWLISPLSSGSGVLAAFQANTLIGMCPRIQHNGVIYFTLDGTLRADIGTAPIAAGSIVIIDLSVTFNGAAVHVVNVAGLGTADQIWAASFDGADIIWFMSQFGVLYKYSVSASTASVVINAMGLSNGFKLRGNIKYSLGQLYCCSLDGFMVTATSGTMIVDVTSYPVVSQVFFEGYFDESAIANTCFHSHNALPLGNCLVAVTGEGYQAASPPGAESGAIAIYKTDGTFLERCSLANGQNIYNLAAISGVGTPYTPTTLIPV